MGRPRESSVRRETVDVSVLADAGGGVGGGRGGVQLDGSAAGHGGGDDEPGGTRVQVGIGQRWHVG